MEPPKRKPLHNFSMPGLKWGKQKSMRCVKVTDPDCNDDNNVAQMKPMTDLKVSTDKPKVSISNKEKPTRPLNLRSQRAATNKKDEEKKKNIEWPKFSISLSKEEIEQDFLAMVGTKPHKKPNKRPRSVQRELDVSKNNIIYNIFFSVLQLILFELF